MLCMCRTSGPSQGTCHPLLPFSTNRRELCGPPSGEGWALLIRSSHFKQQLGNYLPFKCSDNLPLQHSFRPFPLTFNYLHIALPQLQPWVCGVAFLASPYTHGGCHSEAQPHPAWTCSSLDLFPEGKGLLALHQWREALLYCCLWLIGSLRPDILQDILHKHPGKLSGTEGASG